MAISENIGHSDSGKPEPKKCDLWKILEEYHNTMVVPTLNKLIILRGIPSSGKSTYIKELGLGHFVLSMDKLRLMYEAPDPYISQENNSKVHKLYMEMLESRMKTGSFTIVDATHTTKKYVNSYDNLCKKYFYEKHIKTINVSLEEALDRNTKREKYKQVPCDVIEKMYTQIKQTFINEKTN